MEEIIFACQVCGKRIAMPIERRGHVEICPHCENYVDVSSRSLESTVIIPCSTSEAKEADKIKNSGPDSRSISRLWLEVLAVLCLYYIPSQFSGLMGFFEENSTADYSIMYELWRMIAVLRVSAPLLLIIALTKDPWSQFGIVRPRWIVDAIGGCLLYLCGMIACYFTMTLIPLSMLKASGSANLAVHAKPEGILECGIALVAIVASSFSQELVMRGYLIPRLERLLGSTVKAVLITSILYGGYHIYQGAVPVLGHITFGLVYAIAFCFLRRLWPLCLAHAIANAFVVMR